MGMVCETPSTKVRSKALRGPLFWSDDGEVGKSDFDGIGGMTHFS